MRRKIKQVWRFVRQLSGDDAYERYLARFNKHQAMTECCPKDEQPLTKAEFFRQWQDAKWEGVKRCC